MKDNHLYVPLGVKIEAEIFTGFGKKEMKKAFLAILLFNLINAVITVFKQSIPFTMIYFMISVFVGITIFVKDDSNISFVDQLQFFIRFYRSQKKLKYIYQEEL